MSEKTILLCMGTRPEIIKMAPVYYALKQNGLEPLLLHTGQHEDMADPMYRFFNILPDFSLPLERRSDALHHLSAMLLEKLGAAFESIKPGAVLVHGDTASAAMAALAAFYQRIPVGHVEAGLRSHNRYNPFPEEKNRELIARLADWHFAPTQNARQNLLRENIDDSRIHLVGNTIVDAVRLATSEYPEMVADPDEMSGLQLRGLRDMLPGSRLLFITAHRRENLGRPLLSISSTVRKILIADEKVVIVWPVHSNPKVRATVDEVFADLPEEVAARIFLTRPLSYSTTLNLLKRAWLVLTDSGGIQEEAACLHVPVLILREATERPELVSSGGGRLIGTSSAAILNAVGELRDNPAAYQAMCDAINPFGDGYAADRIKDILTRSMHG
ncbi:UDP-N-acetylglucosamine 2-epimerase (non-hydrolyzing) [Pseudoduganella sp. DS3]|uniref:UDP-N-acetylglucosamine 2-epimerase (non-hydrolyzing) n=1 Tax=Pseudoduganella guangdongensis TaxID=2692179 RepID=A0A6N9HHM8_9BURK|nr:UDP-N-acetylglucosamine 2-epimerase (non-hydrolyzing) [Pseudoduganella guangdongensis]MYN02325.1 UDP-N-acetylglucosamine 2-epimerase (non-hydrolyzing) [Pseudoduganella guangdongensis]